MSAKPSDKDVLELADMLLNDDEGIGAEAYSKLLSLLSESAALELDNRVDGTDGRFYLP